MCPVQATIQRITRAMLACNQAGGKAGVVVSTVCKSTLVLPCATLSVHERIIIFPGKEMMLALVPQDSMHSVGAPFCSLSTYSCGKTSDPVFNGARLLRRPKFDKSHPLPME
eukprot:scaffold185380_cov18-Tisochrysis_lutea.AAC.1